MSCVRFKFKSSLEYEKLPYDGLQLSVAELRKKIMTQKKLGMSDDFTLQIMDAQSKKIYSNDDEMVPRNTSVVIMRVPVISSRRLPKTQLKDISIPKDNGFVSEHLKKTGDLAGADATEEEKVLAMMSQAGEEYNQANYAKFRPRIGGFNAAMVKQPPPPNYICHRCGKKGHWIKFCPTNGDPAFDNSRIKAPSGIPKSHVVSVTTDTQGAMKDRQGNLVKRKVDILAASDTKVTKPIAAPVDTSVPPELTCSICKDLIKDAVIIPCCGESFCDECIREYLLENEFKCFACEETDVSPDTLVSNKRLRNDAKKFQSQVVQRKRLAVTRGLPSVVLSQEEDTPTSGNFLDDLTPPTQSLVSSQDGLSPAPPLSPRDETTPSPAHRPGSGVSPGPGGNSSAGSGNEDRTPTPPPLISSKSPVAMETTTIITKPISLSSNTRPITSTAAFTVPPSLMTMPIINPLSYGIPGVLPMAPPTMYPVGGLLQPLSMPPVAPMLSMVPPPVQPSSNSLLLQAAGQGTMDPGQMARLMELLAAAENHKKSPSPAPLSYEEFLRQQNVLQGFDFPPRRSPTRSNSYSSYSSRSPTPTGRGVRSRSHSRSPGRHASSSRRGLAKRHRHRSPLDREENSRLRKKRRDRSSDKPRKSHKRKERHRSTTPPPVNDGEGLEEVIEKRHKKKKRKHSRSDKDLPNEVEPTVTMDTDSKGSIESGGDMTGDVPLEDNSSRESEKSVQDPAAVEGVSPTGTCTSDPHGRRDNSVELDMMDIDVLPKPSQDSGCDTDVLSGGSTPLLAPPLSPSDSASLLERPCKHAKKRKHKHKSRSSEKEKKSDKDRRRHRKHRSERQGKNGSHEKSSSRKKSRRKD